MRLLLLIAFLVVGCGGTTTETGSAAPVASSASSSDGSLPSGLTSPEPRSSAPVPTPSGPVAFEAGFPDAGTYTTTAFRPRLTVQLGDDAWRVLFQDDEDELALEGDSGDGMMFLAARVSRVVGPDGRVVDAPDDLVEWLRRYPSLTAAAPLATTVDSRPATSIDVTNEGSEERDLFAFPTGNFHIPPGVRLRFTVVPMDAPDLVITTGGPIDHYDAAMARTKPMIDSLQIGD